MQIKFLPFLIWQLFTVRADQFDSGTITIVVSPNSISTGQITFHKVFTTEPQVAILSFNFDIPTQAEFSFQIGNITKTKFDYKIKTLWNALNQYAFYWRAMDDKRIEVIYSYDTNVSGVGNKSFPFSHSKPCALYGFVSPLNFGVKGAIYFDLKIVQITKSQVIVGLTQNTTNLLTLGFVIVLGSDQSFINNPSMTKYNIAITNPIQIFSYVNQKPGYQLFINCNNRYISIF